MNRSFLLEGALAKPEHGAIINIECHPVKSGLLRELFETTVGVAEDIWPDRHRRPKNRLIEARRPADSAMLSEGRCSLVAASPARRSAIVKLIDSARLGLVSNRCFIAACPISR